jgi:hypothetical protein
MADKKSRFSGSRSAAMLLLAVFTGGALAAYSSLGHGSSMMEWLPVSEWGFGSRTMTMNVRPALGAPPTPRTMVTRKLGIIRIVSVNDP